MADKTPTWGYHAVEPARIFHLAHGQKLPEGWADTPAAFAGQTANDADAPVDASSALEAAEARIRQLEQVIEKGKADNERLAEELKDADEEADVAAAQVKALTDELAAVRATAEKLQAENDQLRAGHVSKPKSTKGQ